MQIGYEKRFKSKINTDKMKIYSLNDHKKNILIVMSIALFVILWSIILYYHPPNEIVSMMGVRNVYAFIFMMALVGGVSTFTSTAFYTSLVAISLSGVNGIWVAFFASIGLTLGDVLFYFFGMKCKQCIRGKYGSYVDSLTEKMERFDDRITMILIFLYSLTPLPSDIIAIALAILGFPFKKMIAPLLAGNFTLILLLVELSRLGYSLI